MNYKILIYTTMMAFHAIVSAENKNQFTYSNSNLTKIQNSIRGQLRAKQFTTLAAGLSGQLKQFNVTRGQMVNKDQLIAMTDCQLEQAEKKVLEAKLSAAQSKLQINTQLAQYKNISDLDLVLSKADVQIQQAELIKIETTLAKCVINAPFNGIVTEKMAQAFQYVKEGEPLLELVDTRHLEIEMVIPSKWLSRLAVGTVFSVQLDEISTPIMARVNRHLASIDPVSQTIRVIGELLNPPANLLPGMSGDIHFSTSH